MAVGNVMNAAQQISRRFGRTTGARTHSAASDCIVRTVSFGADPLETTLWKLVRGRFLMIADWLTSFGVERMALGRFVLGCESTAADGWIAVEKVKGTAK